METLAPDSRVSRLVSKEVCEWLVEEAAGKLDMLLNTMEDLSPLLLALFFSFWVPFCFLVVVFFCWFFFKHHCGSQTFLQYLLAVS